MSVYKTDSSLAGSPLVSFPVSYEYSPFYLYQPCRPANSLPAPASALSVSNQNFDALCLLRNDSARYYGARRRIINLFLELFGECEIRHANLQAITPPNIRKVNWRLLPPGQYPWSRVREHVNRMLEDKAPRYANPIHNRLGKIASFNPDEVYVGQGGFWSYIAYIFNDKELQ